MGKFNISSFDIILITVCLFLIGCIYYRTPYFDSSIMTQTITFEEQAITSKKWYVDMGGNYILLDKNVVIPKGKLGIISIETKNLNK